jgi:6-phosphogluconolactonase
MSSEVEVSVVADASALADEAARAILDAARDAVAAGGPFRVALAGGATPRATYTRLAMLPFVDRMPWDRTWVFFGDDRAVGPDHPESNYRLAYDTMLSKVPIPPEQVFRIRGEAEDPEDAAAEYARQLATAFGLRRGEVPRFDLVLLGLGIDGHTASLFPGSPALREVFRTVAAVHAAEAIIPTRITLTLPVISAARQVLFLASGAEKAKMLKAVLVDRANNLPATMAVPSDGKVRWIVDREAAALLPDGRAR